MASTEEGNIYIKSLSQGPLRRVKSYPVYFINGFKFQTQSYGGNRQSMNCGVSITGGDVQYVGKLTEIIVLEFPGWPIKETVLLKCDWFDPTPNVGTRVNKYGMVEVNLRRKFKKFEPFILALQATQAYFVPSPRISAGQAEWVTVFNVRRKEHLLVKESTTDDRGNEADATAFQEEEPIRFVIDLSGYENLGIPLNDSNSNLIELDGATQDNHSDHSESDDETELYSGGSSTPDEGSDGIPYMDSSD